MAFLNGNALPPLLTATFHHQPWTLSSFPLELVALIFRHAASNEPDRKVNCLLSHTCRHWRQVALACSLLWQTIKFTTSHDPEYHWPELCIARSKNCVINIIITRGAFQFDVDNEERERRTIERAVTRISSLLVPEARRWGIVDISLPNPHLYNLLHEYLTRVSEPSTTEAAIAELQLTVTRDRGSWLNLPKLVFPPGYGRKLTRLVLTINVDWKEWDFTNLTYLKLAGHERETVRPRLSELYDMLSCSLLLEELHFNGSGPCANAHEATSVKRFVILEKLHTLTIGRQISANDVVALIHTLRAPQLDRLTISEWHGDKYDPAITLLGSPDLGYPSITYLHFRRIDMSDSTPGTEAFGEFLRSITNVTHLFAEFSGMNPLSVLLTDPAPHLRCPVPQLQCFQVTGPHRALICGMVEAREAIGRPLRKLILAKLDTEFTFWNEPFERMADTVLYVDYGDDGDDDE